MPTWEGGRYFLTHSGGGPGIFSRYFTKMCLKHVFSSFFSSEIFDFGRGVLVENFSPGGQDLRPQDVNYGTSLIALEFTFDTQNLLMCKTELHIVHWVYRNNS